MSKELVISSNHHETRVGILEDDQLVEIYFQRANEYSLAGSIHKGRVTRVLPGMQSAFVDLGLERDTFLYVSDFLEEAGDDIDRDERPSGGSGGGERRERRDDRREDRRESRRSAEQQSPAIQAPPPAVMVAPAIIEADPVEADEAVETVSAAAPEVRGEDDGGRGDRRGGRRSRRRRSRGRGFPDSKYASDVRGGERGGPAAAEPAAAVEEEEEESAPAEVILLPGESLAKYTNRSTSAPAPAPSVEDEEPEVVEDEDPVLAVEAAEVVEEAAEVTIEESEDEAESEFSVEADSSEPAIDDEEEEEEDDEEVADEVEELRTTAEIEEQVEAAEARLEAEAILAGEEHDEPEIEDADEVELDVTDPDLTADAASVDTDEDEIQPAVADADDIAVADLPVEAEETTPAATASVRDQSDRYQHRQGGRRMRRRGRGGERGERGGDRGDRGERAPSPTPAAAAAVESRGERERERPPLPSISELLREGQEIIVQIAKEPLGQKGARITSHIALPGRFVVYMPTLDHVGVSRKIASDEERQRLKRILQASRAGLSGGFICRTAGEGRSEEEIASDMAYLYNLWLDIRQKAEKRKAPALLHHDLDIVHRILRDQLSDMFKAIWVDNEEVYESVLRFMQRFQPQLVGRVKMYTRPAPIFDAFSITTEIEKALKPKVWLKSGGYIVINQTEALVAIDVNTGKFVGKSNRLEDTITKTNTEAVKEIVRQIRLRDLGGIIVVDFIDMDERKNRQKVMQALEEAMRSDRAPYKILQFNDFGLVAITRKRVKQSLERTLCAPCATCEGAGYTKSVATVIGEILIEANKIRPSVEGKNVELRVYPSVAKHLKSNQNSDLEEIEAILGCPVLVVSDASLHPEKFDMAW